MFKIRKVLFVSLFIMAVAGTAFGASNDTITVNYEVLAVNELNIDGASVTLTVDGAGTTAGSAPSATSDDTTYDITTNVANPAVKKLTAAINTDMPTGLTLTLNATAPSTGLSAGAVTITHTAADVVTSIDAVAESDINMSFGLSATVAAGTVASATKTLTLTLTD
jgi:hypothetical protein